MLIRYVEDTMGAARRAVVVLANAIVAEYQAQGFTLTLRQLFYQFVARDLIPNTQREYKRLGAIVSDARLMGLMSWEAIEDRTRWIRRRSSWSHPSSIVESAARSFHRDLWAGQEWRPQVWIEKDALVGVIEPTCEELDVPFFACRGYASQSSLWEAAQAMKRTIRGGQGVVVFHLGDHDPSGLDMSRDMEDRLRLFLSGRAGGLKFTRLALNRDQVDEHEPPPNPAKLTDSRVEGYIAEHGEESWELDALEPRVIAGLIVEAVEGHRDLELWDAQVELQERQRAELQAAADHWDTCRDALMDAGELADDPDASEEG